MFDVRLYYDHLADVGLFFFSNQFVGSTTVVLFVLFVFFFFSVFFGSGMVAFSSSFARRQVSPYFVIFPLCAKFNVLPCFSFACFHMHREPRREVVSYSIECYFLREVHEPLNARRSVFPDLPSPYTSVGYVF